MEILQLNVDGAPLGWISPEAATTYYATDSVAWSVGDVVKTMRGGFNAANGRHSAIDLHPIIATRGAARISLFDAVPTLTNAKLFKRDRFQCCYCGTLHGPHGRGLTREHIVPVSRGGRDEWSNVASACGPCNHIKGARTLQETGLRLRYVPYVPSVFEDILLKSRVVTGDAHDWLARRVGKGSRWYAY